MTDQKIEAFLDDPQTETLFLIGEIGDTDTELALDIYTRNQRNAKLALEDLKAAIEALLDDWPAYRRLPPATNDLSEKSDHVHHGGRWPLRIVRSPVQ